MYIHVTTYTQAREIAERTNAVRDAATGDLPHPAQAAATGLPGSHLALASSVFQRGYDAEADCLGIKFKVAAPKGTTFNYIGCELFRLQALVKLDCRDHCHMLGIGDRNTNSLDAEPVIRAGMLTAGMLNTRFRPGSDMVPTKCLFKHVQGTSLLKTKWPSPRRGTVTQQRALACDIRVNHRHRVLLFDSLLHLAPTEPESL